MTVRIQLATLCILATACGGADKDMEKRHDWVNLGRAHVLPNWLKDVDKNAAKARRAFDLCIRDFSREQQQMCASWIASDMRI